MNIFGIRKTQAQTLLIGSLAWVAFATPGSAGDLTQQQILEKLMPHPQIITRSLTATPQPVAAEPASGDHQALAETLRHRGNRPLTGKERDEIAAWTGESPSVDLQIYFDFNSSAISLKAVPQLTSLGNALAGSELKNSLVTINGHTDGKGNDAYNQQLSERRADSIKHYLVEHFNLSPDNLVAVGFGKQKLKDPAHPLASENRRVEVVNLASQAQARN